MVDNPRDFQKNQPKVQAPAKQVWNDPNDPTLHPVATAPAAAFYEPLDSRDRDSGPEHVKSEQLQDREAPREFVFEPGDVVKLKSGGPDMTVHSYQRLDRGAEGVMSEIQTLWHGENGELHHGHFAHKTDEDLERIFEEREHEGHEDRDEAWRG